MSEHATIREAKDTDLAAIDDLLRAHAPAGHAQVCLGDHPGHRHLLVLDAPDGGLAAAALVTLEAQFGHLGMLVVAPRFAGQGIETRMIGVAESLCRAFGVEMIDVVARRAA